MKESLAVSVRRRRLARGLTQGQLADLAGVGRGTVRRIELGEATYPQTAFLVETAFSRFDDSAATSALTAGPVLLFVTPEGTRHAVDSDGWSAGVLSPRNRALLEALLGHATARLADQDRPARPLAISTQRRPRQ